MHTAYTIRTYYYYYRSHSFVSDRQRHCMEQKVWRLHENARSYHHQTQTQNAPQQHQLHTTKIGNRYGDSDFFFCIIFSLVACRSFVQWQNTFASISSHATEHKPRIEYKWQNLLNRNGIIRMKHFKIFPDRWVQHCVCALLRLCKNEKLNGMKIVSQKRWEKRSTDSISSSTTQNA